MTSQIHAPIDVYAQATTGAFVLAACTYLRQHDRRTSQAALLRKSGYQSRSAFSNVTSGRSLPSVRLINVLVDQLGLSDDERIYLHELLNIEKLEHKGHNARQQRIHLTRMNPIYHDQMPLDEAAFRLVADWYCLPIKELVGMPGFKKNLEWIEQRLRHKVKPNEIMKALEALKRLGLIKVTTNGNLVRTVDAITSSIDIPSPAIRHHHRQMMARASESLDELPVDQREVSSITILMEMERMDEAKKELARFRERFRKKYSSPAGTGVAQLNMQLFEHTDTLTNSKKGRLT